MPRWETVSRAAEILNKSERTIRRWIAADKIPHKKSPSGIVIDISELVTTDFEQEPAEPDMPPVDNELLIRLARLEAENELLREDRDYLRQALAAAMETTQNLITAGTPEDDTKTTKTKTSTEDKKRRWYWPFGND